MLLIFRRVAVTLIIPLLILAAAGSGSAAPPVPRGRSAGSGRSLDLAVGGYGISLGNSKRFRGLRINAVDRDVENVIGVNVTLWRPDENPDAVVHGIAVGLYGPS
ncbi:MAG TPA: hypothetical protein VMX58_02830, partial [Patescibacteria group bacterium]|nr:hypothetical protein [Patescibacteria group bacterium]